MSEVEKADFLTLLIVYRGYHCPVCKSYIPQLDKMRIQFEEMGVQVIAASSDSKERAEQTVEEWEINELKVGYGLSIEKAREFGLYISKGIKEEEPEIFSEPGLFLIKLDRPLYAAAIQTMPFARPNLRELLQGLQFVKQSDYLARGEA
ncbi:redoxin domain-containing protein [Pontibacter toksunensis]|uniref:Redoxin domain-containing protein n=1 Tax=Pontibacter toksunensis TaxID=1332631 RepID=A0ABW6BWZ9_9BACT